MCSPLGRYRALGLLRKRQSLFVALGGEGKQRRANIEVGSSRSLYHIVQLALLRGGRGYLFLVNIQVLFDIDCLGTL